MKWSMDRIPPPVDHWSRAKFYAVRVGNEAVAIGDWPGVNGGIHVYPYYQIGWWYGEHADGILSAQIRALEILKLLP